MTDFLDQLNKLRRYIHLYIDGNLPSVQTVYKQPNQGDFEFNLIMNAPISFKQWLTYPYETREEEEKILIL